MLTSKDRILTTHCGSLPSIMSLLLAYIAAGTETEKFCVHAAPRTKDSCSGEDASGKNCSVTQEDGRCNSSEGV
jgi:hypothetical protein